MPAGVEEYTEEHWAILSPKRLGFKGSGRVATTDVERTAEAAMARFYEPHNARLAALMAAQGWPWTPFAPAAAAAAKDSLCGEYFCKCAIQCVGGAVSLPGAHSWRTAGKQA